MKKFVYQVANHEFTDSVAFGEAWKEAKHMAKMLHMPIYRLVINGEKVKQEVYYKSGCFNSIQFATANNIEIF